MWLEIAFLFLQRGKHIEAKKVWKKWIFLLCHQKFALRNLSFEVGLLWDEDDEEVRKKEAISSDELLDLYSQTRL